ncbi:hypothetical protein [Nocardiopsis sp. ATB16-24]|uniref:hypothetical protein n=1 Tax=Nocardiopsis sp. ATB16-24 TaxID=3019555 RepID=UPI002555CA63|nr:hypothetical protein [Nocardiopsis sp. ATB16-24]
MTQRSELPARTVPVLGLVCAVACLLAMAGTSWMVWDLVPETVTTREASGQRDAVHVPRPLFLSLAPAVTVLVTSLLVAVAPLDRVIEHRVGLRVGGDARARARTLDAVLVVMSLLFLVLHFLVIAVGTNASVPVLPIAASLGGVVLMVVGVLMSVSTRSWSMPEAPSLRKWSEAWRRAQPLTGRVMAVSGGLLALAAPAAFVLLPGPLLGNAVMAAVTVAATLLPFGAGLVRAASEVRRDGSD